MRIRGGTRGIIAAISTGRLDPLDAWLPDERGLGPLTPGALRKIKRRQQRRERERTKRLAAASPF